MELRREKFCASTWLRLFLTPGANGPKKTNPRTIFLQKRKKENRLELFCLGRGAPAHTPTHTHNKLEYVSSLSSVDAIENI